MKKNILTCIMVCMCAAFTASAGDGFNDEITDWSYVEDGTIYAKVYVDNAEGVAITPAGATAPVQLTDGVNTVMVPLARHTYEVAPKEGFTLTVKVGDVTYTGDNLPVVVDCARPAQVYITAESQPSGITAVGSDDTEARYFDLNGLSVDRPIAGKYYIKVSGSKTEKVKF
ncbi:MAG: hypothetical protein K2M68_02225 [Muribaculaceae bacterium]|nr:hypothetical protein [Muribaculaceae bacterium]